jgi:hypothetical protein
MCTPECSKITRPTNYSEQSTLNYSATAFSVTKDVLRSAVLKAAPMSSGTWHHVVGYTDVFKKPGVSIITVNFTLYHAVTAQRGSRRVPPLFNLGAIRRGRVANTNPGNDHPPYRRLVGLRVGLTVAENLATGRVRSADR